MGYGFYPETHLNTISHSHTLLDPHFYSRILIPKPFITSDVHKAKWLCQI